MSKTQESAILAHLQSGKTLTPLQALKRFKCLRLSGRIYDLRKHFVIHSESVWVGEKRVSRYSMP